ncbi:hypothetical protein DXG01_009577 [Tephrocybe rancida]|nr:hypothetical protein DXG01_009577 [Tephrocybe rancida]
MLPDYFASQKHSKKKFSAFWARLKEEWEEQFSTTKALFPGRKYEDLGPHEQATVSGAKKAKYEQLQTWFRWRATPKAWSVEKSSSTLKDLTDANRSRLPHHSEIYTKLFENKIQPVLQVKMEGQEFRRGGRLALRNKTVRELWNQETDEEVKLAVEAHLAALITKRVEISQITETHTPEQYAQSIQDTPAYLGRVFEGLHARTGWAFSVLMGGPDPNIKGDINVASYHVCENGMGKTFAESNEQFERDYMTPYMDFLMKAFPQSIRDGRLLAGANDPVQHANSKLPDAASSSYKGVDLAVGLSLNGILPASTSATALPVVMAAAVAHFRQPPQVPI